MSEQTQEQQKYLIFMLGQEMFAVNILAIKEIIEHGLLTEVPMMQSFVRGVINFRGRAVQASISWRHLSSRAAPVRQLWLATIAADESRLGYCRACRICICLHGARWRRASVLPYPH